MCSQPGTGLTDKATAFEDVLDPFDDHPTLRVFQRVSARALTVLRMIAELPPNPPPAGWYVDPKMAGTQRYWDGVAWTDQVAPWSPPAAKTAQQSQLVVALVLAGSAVGLVMALQSASLLTGTGTLWTGAAIASGASIAAWVMKASLPKWVRVVAVVAAVLAVSNAAYVEYQLEQTRQEMQNLFP